MGGPGRDRHLRRRRASMVAAAVVLGQRQRRRRSRAAAPRPRNTPPTVTLSGLVAGDRLRAAGRAAVLPLPRRLRRAARRCAPSWSGWRSSRRSSSPSPPASTRASTSEAAEPFVNGEAKSTLTASEAAQEMQLGPEGQGREGASAKSGTKQGETPVADCETRKVEDDEAENALGEASLAAPRSGFGLAARHRPRGRPLLQLPVGDADRPAVPLLGLAGDGARRRRSCSLLVQFTLIFSSTSGCC